MKTKVNKISKSTIIACIICSLIFCSIGVGATTLLYSKDITYDNSSSGLSSTNLQDALDELYEQAKTGGASVSCDDDGNCTVTCKKGELITTDTGYSCHTTVTCPSGLNYVGTSTGYKCKQFPVKENVVTTGDGLYADSLEIGKYIYRGANPDNYITFNDETWRIISFESDETIKIIKDTSIGNLAWDTKGNRSQTDYCNDVSVGCNSWGSSTTTTPSTMARVVGGTSYALPSNESSLNIYLNGTYYNSLTSTAKSQIITHTFNVGIGGDRDDESAISTLVKREKANKWSGKIALMNITDFMRATIETSCAILSDGWNSKCYRNNWMFKSTTEWTLSPVSDSNSITVWVVRSAGNFYSHGAIDTYGVRPVVFLSSSITLSGSGTQSDPYTIN